MTISATTRGLRPGVCTSTTRPGSPYDGQLIYETDTNRVAVYDTSSWVYKTPASTTGSVLQVVSTAKTDTFTTTSTSFTDITGFSATITPTSTSSKILALAMINGSNDPAISLCYLRLVRDSTAIGVGDAGSGQRQSTASLSTSDTDVNMVGTSNIMFLDSPATTSATTYKVQIVVSTGTGFVNRSDNDSASIGGRFASTLTLMEIAG